MECSVCFEDLCSEPCAVFFQAGRRVCGHTMHLRCANELPSHECPICRHGFAEVRRLPPISSDPEGWFHAVDVEGDGRLSRSQVTEVLLTQFPLDVNRFEARM